MPGNTLGNTSENTLGNTIEGTTDERSGSKASETSRRGTRKKSVNVMADADLDTSYSREEIIKKFREQATQLSDQMKDRLKGMPATGREVFGRVDASARANPWLSIGLVGIGALALGFVAGALMSSSSDS